jgi:Tfp pilus assembly major pilin PilA
MARRKSASSSGLNTTLVIVLIIGVIAGFAAGYLLAKNHYTEKITAISKLNMEKAVTIDNLNQEIQVLGASTNADK